MSETGDWVRKKLSDLPDDWAGTIRWLLSSVGGSRGGLVLLSALRTSSVLLGVASAAVNRVVIDAATARSGGVWLAILVFVAVQAGASGVSMGLSWLSTTLGERLSNDVRSRLYRSVLASRWSSLGGYHSEQLLSRLTSDVSSISSGLTGTAVSLLAMGVQALAALALLLRYDASLAVFVLVVTPVAVLVSAALSVRLRILQQRVQQAEADYRQRAQETIAHVDVVKAFGAEDAECRALSALQGEHERLLRRRARLTLLANAVMSLAFVGSYLFAFVHGILGIMGGTVSYGTFAAFLSLVGQVQSSLSGLSAILPRAASVVASAARVRELSELPGEAEPLVAPRGADGGCAPLGIRARGLSFSYPGTRGAPVLDRFDLDVAPGEVVALMGPSGTGKTTLVRLLLGLLAPDSGELSLVRGDAALDPRSARPEVAYVPQGNTLFSGTVRENLLMGNPGATEDDLLRALDAARALDFVRGLPGGLDARVGERALGLSEGQAQRIAIARALVRPAGLLVLDEATSALDEGTELAVMRALRSLERGPTCLVITHRPEVAPLCDRLLGLGGRGPSRDGRAECGSAVGGGVACGE